MFNWVDGIIILIVLMGALRGRKQGLVGSIFGLASSILGFILALKFYPLLVGWLNDQFQVQFQITQWLEKYLILPEPVFQFSLDKLPLPVLIDNLEKIDFPIHLKEQFVTYLQQMLGNGTGQSPLTLGSMLHQFLSSTLLKALAFVTIWFAVNLVLSLFVKGYRLFTKETILGRFDSLGGFFIGGLISAFILTIIIGFSAPLFTLGEVSKPTLITSLLQMLNKSQLVPHFLTVYAFLSDKILSWWF